MIAQVGSGPRPPGARRRFPAFPHAEPYDVQTQFMQGLFDVLQAGGVGLFESPTGTGKTLSLICGALQWLEDRRCEKELLADCSDDEPDAADAAAKESADSDGDPDWLREWTVGKSNVLEPEPAKRQAKKAGRDRKPRAQGAVGEEEFLLEEWAEDRNAKRMSAGDPLSSSGESGSEGESTLPDHLGPVPEQQVIFCSRTHSQLTQFVGELRRTPFATSMSAVPLASRKALCINEDVMRLGSAARINERCLDLQDAKRRTKIRVQGVSKRTKKAPRCPYLVAPAEAQQGMQKTLLEAPLDVEDLGRLGRKRSCCPYYAARHAHGYADVVFMPYSALLSSEARESFGVRLKDAIVIVDEAHNLVDAVNSVHSCTLAEADLSAAQAQLSAYQARFRSRLGPGNLCNLDTLLSVASRLRDAVREAAGVKDRGPTAVRVASVNDFLFSSNLDNVNLFQLLRYVRENKVVFKVSGYAESAAAAPQVALSRPDGSGNDRGGRSAAMQALAGFLAALTNSDADGRIVIEAPGAGSEGRLKFILLNASAHFSQVLSEAHAVVLASGTLAPVDSLVMQLFPTVDLGRLHHFSCGHVVPPSQLLALPLGSGPSGIPLDLRHSCRSQHATLDQVAAMLKNLCAVVPHGMVVFFPSFGYLAEFQQRALQTGALESIGLKKKVFIEPRAATAVDQVLVGYSDACRESAAGGAQQAGPSGGLLLSVVGGKMAEGINFGDSLGRCVVMVGLPYPNAGDPELKERMAHLDRLAESQGNVSSHGALRRLDGRSYYEDLCMKAVNQCIGRVIRHAGDYAAIVLADQRYANAVKGGTCSGPLAKLPDWIKPSVRNGTMNFGIALKQLKTFFHSPPHQARALLT